MNAEEQLQVYTTLHENLINITKSKRHDYADEDVLSNFKSVSQAAKNLGIDIGNPVGYSLFMVLLKIARINNLINKNKTPNNESLEDSFMDGINYFNLAFCCHKDSQKQ